MKECYEFYLVYECCLILYYDNSNVKKKKLKISYSFINHLKVFQKTTCIIYMFNIYIYIDIFRICV